MSNPTKIYNDYVRANLPNTMTFNSSTARYNINNHSFFSFNRANWYFKYITKFGYTSLSVYAVNNFDPDLVFDFKQNYYRTGGTETTLSSAVTHTRAGNATMTNSDGDLVTVGNNVARTGHHVYNGSAWVNEGILHESEARTNLLTSSGDLTGTGWTGGATASTVTTGSPFGTYQTLSPTGNGVNLALAQRYQIGKPITSGSTYVGWALAKYSVGSGWFVVNMYDTGKGNEQAYFDLQNGVVGSKESLIIDHGMVDYGDGWWLCWASSNAASNNGGVSYEMPNGDGVQSCTATDVILIAGSQYELGSTPSSYIPTSGSTVTRAADTLTVPAANLPYSSTNMSIQMDGRMTYADDGATAFFYRWLLSPTNYAQTVLQTTGSYEGRIRFSQRETTSGYDEVVTSNSYFTPDINVPFNISSRHGSTFLNGAEGGTALTADTTVTALPDLSSSDLLLANTFMGTIGKFRVWDEDLTDTGIAEAST